MNEPAFNVALQKKPDVLNEISYKPCELIQKPRLTPRMTSSVLGFDPFIGGQDPANRYEGRNAVDKQ